MLKVIKHTFKTLEVKKSKFITHIIPMDEFEAVMLKLKKEHPKARHFVYAYRFLNEYGQTIENQTDDGEPKGSSGKPALAVIRGKNLINSSVIIVRYFGGIKLGVGGLVRAYSDSVNQALAEADIVEYKKTSLLTYKVPYNLLKKIEHTLNKFDVSSLVKEYQSDSVKVKFEVVVTQKNEVMELLNEYLNQ